MHLAISQLERLSPPMRFNPSSSAVWAVLLVYYYFPLYSTWRRAISTEIMYTGSPGPFKEPLKFCVGAIYRTGDIPPQLRWKSIFIFKHCPSTFLYPI